MIKCYVTDNGTKMYEFDSSSGKYLIIDKYNNISYDTDKEMVGWEKPEEFLVPQRMIPTAKEETPQTDVMPLPSDDPLLAEALKWVQGFNHDGTYKDPAYIAFREVLNRYAALSQSKDGWQPIETAPKDNTRIIVYCNDFWETIVRWNSLLGDFWLDDSMDTPDGEPTHWMPLPSPPITNGESE